MGMQTHSHVSRAGSVAELAMIPLPVLISALTLQPPPSQASDSLRQLQLADATLAPLQQGKEVGFKPGPECFAATSKSVRRLLQLWDQLVVHQGILCRRLKPIGNFPERPQTVIPEALQEDVLCNLHKGTMGGHLGTDKTLGRLKERFYWPGYYNDVREWCHNCATCAQRKSPTTKPRAQLTSVVTSSPLQLVAQTS